MPERLLFAKLCGSPTFEWADGTAVHFPSKRGLALFLYLALRSGERVPRDFLADLLWADRDSSSARTALRGTIYEVKQALDSKVSAVLEVNRSHLCVDPKTVESDFTADLAPSQAMEFLSGFEIGSIAFDDWISETRMRLTKAAKANAMDAAENALAEGNGERALDIVTELIAIDPLDESAHRLSMRAKVALGRRSDALKDFDDLQNLLLQELP